MENEGTGAGAALLPREEKTGGGVVRQESSLLSMLSGGGEEDVVESVDQSRMGNGRKGLLPEPEWEEVLGSGKKEEVAWLHEKSDEELRAILDRSLRLQPMWFSKKEKPEDDRGVPVGYFCFSRRLFELAMEDATRNAFQRCLLTGEVGKGYYAEALSRLDLNLCVAYMQLQGARTAGTELEILKQEIDHPAVAHTPWFTILLRSAFGRFIDPKEYENSERNEQVLRKMARSITDDRIQHRDCCEWRMWLAQQQWFLTCCGCGHCVPEDDPTRHRDWHHKLVDAGGVHGVRLIVEETGQVVPSYYMYRGGPWAFFAGLSLASTAADVWFCVELWQNWQASLGVYDDYSTEREIFFWVSAVSLSVTALVNLTILLQFVRGSLLEARTIGGDVMAATYRGFLWSCDTWLGSLIVAIGTVASPETCLLLLGGVCPIDTHHWIKEAGGWVTVAEDIPHLGLQIAVWWVTGVGGPALVFSFATTMTQVSLRAIRAVLVGGIRHSSESRRTVLGLGDVPAGQSIFAALCACVVLLWPLCLGLMVTCSGNVLASEVCKWTLVYWGVVWLIELVCLVWLVAQLRAIHGREYESVVLENAESVALYMLMASITPFIFPVFWRHSFAFSGLAFEFVPRLLLTSGLLFWCVFLSWDSGRAVAIAVIALIPLPTLILLSGTLYISVVIYSSEDD